MRNQPLLLPPYTQTHIHTYTHTHTQTHNYMTISETVLDCIHISDHNLTTVVSFMLINHTVAFLFSYLIHLSLDP